MTQYAIRNLLTGGALLIASACLGIPARPGLITVDIGNGSFLNVRLIGDENFHYYLTEDNYLLAETKDGFFFGYTDADGNILASPYRAAVPSSRNQELVQWLSSIDRETTQAHLSKAAQKASRNALSTNTAASGGPGLFDNTTFPSTGEQKALVILVEFADKKFTLEDPLDYFTRLANQKGFSDYGATGSARDYYLECSGGVFSPTFDVFGPVSLPNTLAYYGGNNSSGKDQRPGEMLVDACRILDPDIDFTQYDRDNDGTIDNVFIFYAGQSEAGGAGADAIWPHSWTLEKAIGYQPVFDGVKLNRYACTNEWQTGRPDGVGTFIHEFSHVLGLPDLYPSGYTGGFTPGDWSVMDHGSYNNNGCTPPLFSSFERYALGWLQPKELTGPASVKLEPIGTNQAFIIKAGKDNEYFLFENRQKTGWDTFLPGHGMLIWHIDYAPAIWSANKVNNTPSHQYVDIEEADGIADEESRSGDPFPGTSGITSYTDDTNPSMTAWTGFRPGLPITNITETDSIISFDVAGGRPEFPPVTLYEPSDVTPEGFTVRWSEAPHALSYLFSLYTENVTGERSYIADRINVGNVNSWTVEDLAPETCYHFFITVVDFVGPCQPSETGSVTTSKITFEYLRPVALSPTEVTADSFTACWEAIEEADNYYVSLYTKRPGTPESIVCDFTGGLENLPAGWKTNVTSVYGTSGFSGREVPALRMAADNAYIETPVFPAPIVKISFWHRGSNMPAENYIRLDAMTGDNWSELKQIPVENSTGGKTVIIEDLPADTRALRISLMRPDPNGILALDDIEVNWNMTYDNIPVEGAIDLPGGQNTYLRISGLQPLTDYYYSLRGGSGTKRTKISNEVKVTTKDLFGTAEQIKAETLSISGRMLEIYGSADTSIHISDIQGRNIGSGKGSLRITLPHAGIYIIWCGESHPYKIAVQ